MHVKNLYIFVFMIVIWVCPCNAQQRTIERIYISTDRDLYIAGEPIWLSLFCFNMSGESPSLSELSSVAYVELRSNESLVSTAKLRIHRGRGSGRLALSPSIPTGNYRLIAYTKQMLNEDTLRYFDKVIPIYNTLSTNKMTEEVFLKEGDESDFYEDHPNIHSSLIEVVHGTSLKTIPQGDSLPLSLSNKSGEAMTLNLSVARVDVPPAQSSPSIQEFLTHNTFDRGAVTFKNIYIPEYEGEIIQGRLKDVDSASPKDNTVFLSAVGSGIDIYASKVDAATGEFAIYTNTLYGNREVVLEYPSAQEASFELFDPFIKPLMEPIPPLFLDRQYRSFLEQRSFEMQVSHLFGIDTLYEKSTIQEDLFSHNTPTVYMLDHYTRFPAMQDIMVEFITEMRFRKVNNRSFLQILYETDFGWRFSDLSLVVVDGIAIFDHERLLQYDPLKVRSVSIYTNRYIIGSDVFDGMAKFNTYTGNYPGLILGKNSLIIDFQGVQYPSRFTGNLKEADDNLPDIRSLLYWDPLVAFMPGESREIVIKTPSISGTYAILVEGVTSGGRAVIHRSEFTVE